jgi:hypothetical protein
MSGSFWVGIAVIVALAAVSLLVLMILRARGKRLPPMEPGAAEAAAEAQQLRDQGRRDGWVP